MGPRKPKPGATLPIVVAEAKSPRAGSLPRQRAESIVIAIGPRTNKATWKSMELMARRFRPEELSAANAKAREDRDR